MRKLIFIVIPVLIQLSAVNVSAYAATLDFGVSISRQSLQAEPAGDNRNIGKMEDDFSVWPTLLLRSKGTFFQDSSWGYSFEFMAGYFDISKQEVNEEQVDLGTSVKGYYAYFIPMFYYRFGNHKNDTMSGWRTTLGIGVGVGYLNVKGDMVMTELSPNIRESIDGDGFGAAIGIYAEFVNGQWFARLSNHAPEVTIGNYDYMLHNVSIIFGRRVYFD